MKISFEWLKKQEELEQGQIFYKGYRIGKPEYSNYYYIFDKYNINVDFTKTIKQAKQNINNFIKKEQ